MILAIYKKNRTKDKWLLSSFALDMNTALEYSKLIITQAKGFGYDNAESTIQSYDSVHNAPKILDKIKPEKLLYN